MEPSPPGGMCEPGFPNLIWVLALFPVVMRITANYVNRKIKGHNEKPMLSAFPEIQEEQEQGLDTSD